MKTILTLALSIILLAGCANRKYHKTFDHKTWKKVKSAHGMVYKDQKKAIKRVHRYKR